MNITNEGLIVSIGSGIFAVLAFFVKRYISNTDQSIHRLDGKIDGLIMETSRLGKGLSDLRTSLFQHISEINDDISKTQKKLSRDVFDHRLQMDKDLRDFRNLFEKLQIDDRTIENLGKVEVLEDQMKRHKKAIIALIKASGIKVKKKKSSESDVMSDDKTQP